MQRDHYGNTIMLGQASDECQKFRLISQIQVCSRLIEQEDLRFLRQGPR
jgi:hypothetical protein